MMEIKRKEDKNSKKKIFYKYDVDEKQKINQRFVCLDGQHTKERKRNPIF